MMVHVYEFDYLNGVKQKKHLVSLFNYNTYIRPLLDSISEEKELSAKDQDKQKLTIMNQELRGIIGDIDPFYELIVETGRFHKAILNGGTLGPLWISGKDMKVNIKQI